MSADISQPLVVAYRDNHRRPNLAYYARMREPMHLPFPACQSALINVGYTLHDAIQMEGRTQKERREERRGVRKQLTLGCDATIYFIFI